MSNFYWIKFPHIKWMIGIYSEIPSLFKILLTYRCVWIHESNISFMEKKDKNHTISVKKAIWKENRNFKILNIDEFWWKWDSFVNFSNYLRYLNQIYIYHMTSHHRKTPTFPHPQQKECDTDFPRNKQTKGYWFAGIQHEDEKNGNCNQSKEQ